MTRTDVGFDSAGVRCSAWHFAGQGGILSLARPGVRWW